MLEEFSAHLYSKALQEAKTTMIGWLFASHEHLSIPELSQLLNFTISQLSTTGISAPIGLKYKPIWDGISKKERKQDHLQVHAIHIDCI